MFPIDLQNPRSQDKKKVCECAEGVEEQRKEKAKDHKRSPIGGNAEEKTEDRKDRSLNTSGNIQRQTKSGLSAKWLQFPFDSSLPNSLRLKNGFLLLLLTSHPLIKTSVDSQQDTPEVKNVRSDRRNCFSNRHDSGRKLPYPGIIRNEEIKK